MKIDKMALRNRELEIASLLPELPGYVIHAYGGQLDIEGNTGGNLYDYLPSGVKSAIGQLMGNLLAQPNALVLAYDLLEHRLGKDGIPPELMKAMNEYIDQSYWRFVPNDAAVESWATILNISEHQFKAIAPKEEIVTLQKTAYDPWIVYLKEEIGALLEGTGVAPGEFWARMQLDKPSSKEALETSALPQGSMEQPYAREMEEAYAQVSIPRTEAPIESAGGGAWGPRGLLSLAMYGALPEQDTQIELTSTTPAGGDGVAASPAGGALSMPSLPSVGLPDFGGVASTPQVGFGGTPSRGATPVPQMLPVSLGSIGTSGGGSGVGLGAYLLAPFKELAALSKKRQGVSPMPKRNRIGKFTERLFQIPQMMLTASPSEHLFAAGGTAGNLLGGLSEPQPPPQIVHRFERGSVQIHTQKIDAKTLGNAFVSFLQEQSRQ